ncbi:ThiF family adenylyltransferase [Parapedobacter sp.]
MENNDRYSRHYRLNGFGHDGQSKLQKAKILIIGAGGLGCPTMQYLVAAGVGTVGIVDHDHIELSNLQRQVLYTTNDVGLLKTTVAAAKLRLLNPEVSIHQHPLFLVADNAVDLIEPYDVVVDCTDNFATRYLLADACRLLDKPLVFGAIYQYEGQVAVFNVADEKGVKTTYRHLFPSPPSPLDAPDCNATGVLGVLPGIIGTLQATETIKLLTGIGQPLHNKLMTINLLDNRQWVFDIPPTLPYDVFFPASLEAFKAIDYEVYCGLKASAVQPITGADLLAIHHQPDVLVVDVRNPEELPKLAFSHLQIPLSRLSEQLHLLNKKHIVVVCQSGVRSLAAGTLLVEKIGNSSQISNLMGGINSLVQGNNG